MSGLTQPSRFRTAQPDHGGVYDGPARFFHWVIVALVAAQYATELIPKALINEDTLGAWHIAIGPTILALMLIRLAWRINHRPPPPPTDLPMALRWLSRATHWAFYAILILLPVLGWTAASGYGATPSILGIIALPALIAKDKATAEAVGGVHGTLAWVLLAIIGLHIAGALYHALIKRDGVAQRMSPFARR